MPSLIDTITDFAVPGRRLFPCDTPTLVRASADAFEVEGDKLPAQEKLAAARHITKRAGEHNVAVHDHRVAQIAGTDLSPLFKVALNTRKDVTAWHPDALRDLAIISEVARGIENIKEAGLRHQLLDKLTGMIEDFDKAWDKTGTWREMSVPDAVDTVFARDSQELNVVAVGARTIRAGDHARIDKTAASKTLTPAAMEAVESWSKFANADWDTQTAVLQFIPSLEK